MSLDRPATTAKLPIIRNIGSTATCELVRNCTASLPSTLSAGEESIISIVPKRPSSPMAAVNGT